jgi:hypothetical protein
LVYEEAYSIIICHLKIIIIISLWQVPPASEITMGHVLDAMKHNFGDLWEDAEMWEVCQYLYGNHKCTVPEKVKAQIPKL